MSQQSIYPKVFNALTFTQEKQITKLIKEQNLPELTKVLSLIDIKQSTPLNKTFFHNGVFVNLIALHGTLDMLNFMKELYADHPCIMVMPQVIPAFLWNMERRTVKAINGTVINSDQLKKIPTDNLKWLCLNNALSEQYYPEQTLADLTQLNLTTFNKFIAKPSKEQSIDEFLEIDLKLLTEDELYELILFNTTVIFNGTDNDLDKVIKHYDKLNYTFADGTSHQMSQLSQKRLRWLFENTEVNKKKYGYLLENNVTLNLSYWEIAAYGLIAIAALVGVGIAGNNYAVNNIGKSFNKTKYSKEIRQKDVYRCNKHKINYYKYI